jgi:tetratricopeptide (TPR) repeat protein
VAEPSAFISYAHKDRAVAQELAFGLQRRGCKVWIDNGELRAGDSLIERLAEGISDADFVIALVSQHSVDSPWCQKELSLAVNQEIDLKGRFGVRRVLPLRVGRVQMPATLRDKFYLDVKRTRPAEVVPRLWEDIVRHASDASTPTVPVKSEAEASYERGVNLYNKGEVAAARRELHDASQEAHHAAALLLGVILYDEGDLEKAADEWQFAAGSDVEEVANAAVINYGRMIATYEFAMDTIVGKARAALVGGREIAQAEKLWLAAAKSDHRDAAWAWIGLGRLREDPAEREAPPDPAGAEHAFDQAARSGHSESRTYALFKLGRIRWKLSKTEEAIATLNVGATTGDREWGPWCAFELGRIYWKEKDDEQARFWWHQAASSGHSDIAESAQEALDDPNSIWRIR